MSDYPRFRVRLGRETGDRRGVSFGDRNLDAEGPIGPADHAIRGIGVGMSRLHLIGCGADGRVGAFKRYRGFFEGLRTCEERAGRAARGSHFSAALR